MLLSFSFDGIKKDFIIAERGKRRSAFAPLRRNLLTIPNMPGAYLQNTQTDVRVIEQPITINGADRFDVRKLEEELAAWLVTKEPKELIFDDEADRVYFAVIDGEVSIEDIARFGRGTIRFICLDPYKYKGITETAFFYTNPSNIVNDGTVETFPIFRAHVLEPITNLDLISDDRYMRIGQPYTVEETPTEPQTVIFDDPLGSLTGWSAAQYVDNGYITGEIAVSPEGSFYPRLFGQVVESGVWQGPSLKKSFSQPIQDFKMEALIELGNTDAAPQETGMIEIYVLDAANNILGKVGIEDRFAASVGTMFKARAGDAQEGNWITSESNDLWKDFRGVVRLEREGSDWHAYIGRINDATGEFVQQRGSKRNLHFQDKEGKYTAPIAQIQIAFRKATDSDACPMYVKRLRAWRINQVQEYEVPYIAEPGDLIEINHQTNNIRINGESRPDLKDFGATFFPLRVGDNPVYYTPGGAVELNVEWRERLL